MRTPRRTTLSVIAVVAVAALSACSGSAGSSGDRVTSTPAGTTTPSDIAAPAETTAPAPAVKAELTVAAVGFVADTYGAHMVFGTLHNPTGDVAYASVNFAAYDAAGTVLGTTSDSTISPSQSDGLVVTDISVPEGAVVAKVDAQVTVSESQLDQHPDIAMTASNIAVLGDKYSTKVTGTIDSTYAQSVTNVGVSAVCSDAAGTVVAAGYTYMDGKVVPGAPAPFSVQLTASSTPTACTVSAAVTNLSEGS
jgi:hypothetical protein